jgi:hypothetical protein
MPEQQNRSSVAKLVLHSMLAGFGLLGWMVALATLWL